MQTTPLLLALSTGFGLGWLAIPHCYAMCGPLHLSICALNWQHSFRSISLLNAGRIFGYTLAGACFGYFGWFISGISKVKCPHCVDGSGPGYLAYLFPALVMFLISGKYLLKIGYSSNVALFFQRFFSLENKKSLILFGITLTLLPCGLLYVAFASAVTTASPLYGAILMFCFVITHTFFLQLGTMVGKLAHKKAGNYFTLFFPWITLLLGIFYLFLFFKSLES